MSQIEISQKEISCCSKLLQRRPPKARKTPAFERSPGIRLALNNRCTEELYMRLAIYILTLILVPILGQAEVSDFNALIDENSKVQQELQENIEEKTVSTAKALEKPADKVVVVESESYNVPTNGRTLKFKKELHQYRASTKKELNRLAEELKSAEREF
jgi:hypothetical protein